MTKTLEIALIASTAVQLWLWLAIYSRAAFHRKKNWPSLPPAATDPLVSVVVCVRNEAANLRKNLPFLFDQAAPEGGDFEIVVVDDASTDATASILADFSKKTARFQVVRVFEKKSAGKKAALAKGIKAARGAVVLLTDADCRPSSRFWLQKMTAPFGDPAIEIVLGYGPFWPEPSALNRWSRFEGLWTAIQYYGLALASWPYMGVGRNLAYRKSLFERIGGFQRHADLTSGDDDLFVSEAATACNTACVIDGEAFSFSEAKKTWRAYFRQKERHYSVGRRYRLFHRATLGIGVLSAGLHYSLALWLVFTKTSMVVVSICIVLRMTALWSVHWLSSRRFGEKGLWFWAPLFDAFLILHYAVFSRSIFFRNNKFRPWT